MSTEEIKEELAEINPDILIPCGLDDGLVGIAEGWFPTVDEDAKAGVTHRSVALYDINKCIEGLVLREGMTYGEAIDYLEYNTLGSYMGEGTPVFARIAEDPEKKSLKNSLEKMCLALDGNMAPDEYIATQKEAIDLLNSISNREDKLNDIGTKDNEEKGEQA